MLNQLTPQLVRRLFYFAAIADAGSIRAAARKLELSVATVSESLMDLEAELGVTLASRNTRRLALTDEGRRVHAIADKMLSAGEALLGDVNDSESVSGKVRATVPVEVAIYWLPPVLTTFFARFPKVKVSISATDAVVDLEKAGIDLAIRATHVPPGHTPPEQPMMTLCCAAGEPLSLRRVDGGWKVPQTLISHSDRPYLDAWDTRADAASRLYFNQVIQVDNKQVALAMAARGMGATLVTTDSAGGYAGVSLAPNWLDFGAIDLTVCFRDKRPSPAAKALRNCLIATA